MNIIIIEDETPALNRIKKLVLEIAPETNILGTADSIESAVKLFNEHAHIDLALLDIELADGQSFEIFKQTTIECPIIFTTAYDEFALKAFKLNSIDYLLKPIDKDELNKAFIKFKSLTNTKSPYQPDLMELFAQFKSQTPTFKTRFLVKTGTKLVSIATDDIAYFYSSDKVVYLQTFQHQKYIIDFSLESLSKSLNPNQFFQLNRQFISNIQSIQHIHTYFNGKLKLDLNPPISEEVIVSREKAAEFKLWLDQ